MVKISDEHRISANTVPEDELRKFFRISVQMALKSRYIPIAIEG